MRGDTHAEERASNVESGFRISGCTKCHDDPPKKDEYAEAILRNKADTAPEFRSWRTKMHFDRVVVEVKLSCHDTETPLYFLLSICW